MYSGKEGAFVLKMVRWHRQKKNNGSRKKRIASAVCMLGVLVVCLGVVGYRNKLKADEKLPVMTRGVIDQIEQIPESKREMYDEGKKVSDYSGDTMKLGSSGNPFFILEIIPYEDYAEFGYQIAGCEPVNVEEMRYGYGGNYFYDTGSYGTFSGTTSAYFFEDELPGNKEHYKQNLSEDDSVDGKEFQGYYKRVNDGEGTFIQKDGNIEKAENGNIIWHTVNDFEKTEDAYKEEFVNQSFSDDPGKITLKKVGDKIYTTRKNTKEDRIVKVNTYYKYKSYDNFLTHTLELSKEEAENYSIIIKTITPKELNANPKWADYADFYTVTPSSHNGKFIEMWQQYNRYEHKASCDRNKDNNHNRFENDPDQPKGEQWDISWEVVKKMYNKITAENNYAAMMMEATTYGTSLKHPYPNGISREILDWNLRPTGQYDESHAAYNSNMYKLTVMLFSMKPDLFKKLYWDSGLINDEGQYLKQSGDAQDYWTMFTFLPAYSGSDAVDAGSWYSYWTSEDKWEKYGIPGNIENKRNYVNKENRLFVYNDGNTDTSNYVTGGEQGLTIQEGNTEYTGFKKWLDEKYPNGYSKITPSDAVEHVLDQKKQSEEKIKGTLNILDIEPSFNRKNAITKKIVVNNGDGCEEKTENGYYLTENYIRIMIPDFVGDINITHMTTAEFIGASEDLNSKYNMIFIGMDSGAYNHDEKGKTKWNDTSMNGKIYFHTGDKMESAESYRTEKDGSHSHNRSVLFLWKETQVKGNDTTLRFPGNDITKIKKKELTSFLNAGYPVVTVDDLYELKDTVDISSNLAAFVSTSKSSGKGFYKTSQTNEITNAIKAVFPKVSFTELPNTYQGLTNKTADSNGNITVNDSNANYLDTDGLGRAILKFSFTVSDVASAKYKCKVYIDQNQDGKFEEGAANVDDDSTGEMYYESDAFSPGTQTITPVKLSKLYYGLIQWKIEVYNVDNKDIHFVETGCSVARNQTGKKRQIKVLQIMPDGIKNDGYLDLWSDSLFTKYYNALNDYQITVDTMTVKDFEDEYFSKKFTYDYSKNISFEKNAQKNPSRMSDKQNQLYNSYNMLILGFGDTFHKVNVSNTNGALDFIKYFIASGKSVLFTHDFTSMHNVDSKDFGYTANRYMRDILGMNRYKSISNELTDSERKELIRYQTGKDYDTVTNLAGQELDYKQGFTYYAMKRLGWTNSDSFNKNQKMPYQYMIKSFMKDEYICSKNDNVKYTGFNNNNDLTKRATKTNTGQITEYPFKIAQTLPIAETHGQWYQLNMEDPEVTVWYCLSDNKNAVPCAWADPDSNGKGTGATYGTSPNDVANNYYIYSKGNVFYSGVGHSTVTGEMEAKLFINTMIAAYRTTYEPPMVEILNEEAELLKEESGNGSDPNLVYKMNWMKEYGNNLDGTKEKIRFSPVELNTVRTKLTCSIQYKDGTYADKIYKKDGTVIEGKATKENPKKYVFENLKNMGEYYFIYDTTGENKKKEGDIVFEIYNNKSKNPDGTPRVGNTTVKMESQNLFLLD